MENIEHNQLKSINLSTGFHPSIESNSIQADDNHQPDRSIA